MSEGRTTHDQERDRIANEWELLTPRICNACRDEILFPTVSCVQTEVRHADERSSFRADVAALDSDGNLYGTVEVGNTRPPTEDVLAAQSTLQFAIYRVLPSAWGDEAGAWFCSVDCWQWYVEFAQHAREDRRSSPAYSGEENLWMWRDMAIWNGIWPQPVLHFCWEATRCDQCGTYFHRNSLSCSGFRSWAYDPYTVLCVHCAAGIAAVHPDVQWRTPGELAGGDPREWTPDEDAGAEDLFMAWCDAAFWEMVWRNRASKLDEDTAYDGDKHQSAEDATARRLPLVNASFDAGEWSKGANLLLPIGAPGWAAYPGEPERLLAFHPDNCRGTALAWKRLLAYRLEMLPQELVDIIRAVNQQASTEADLQPEPSTSYQAVEDHSSSTRQFNDGESWGITENQVDEGLEELNERLRLRRQGRD